MPMIVHRTKKNTRAVNETIKFEKKKRIYSTQTVFDTIFRNKNGKSYFIWCKILFYINRFKSYFDHKKKPQKPLTAF